MPLILPSNSISDLGYEVDNSLRFNSASSDYLSLLYGTSGNRKTFTFSTWLKRGSTGVQQKILGTNYTGEEFMLYFLSTDELALFNYAGGGVTTKIHLKTTQKFRDPSAWYHIVFAIDTTQATASDRANMYINGQLVTDFLIETYPTLNSDLAWISSTHTMYIGGTQYYSGYLAETITVDGSQLDETSFGEFDADSGIWKPIDVSGLTFGSKGFWLDYENSGSLGADVSGNSNNFTVNNLTSDDQTTDTPTNNYATLNAIDNKNSVLSEGNLRTTGSSTWSKVNSTISMPNGSWYVEIYSKVGTGNGNSGIGIKRVESPTNATLLGYESTSYGYLSNGNIYNNNAIITSTGITWSATDIMSMSFTGSVLKFYKNNSLVHTISSLTGEYMFSFGSFPSDSYIVNFGQDGTFSGEVTAQGNTDPNGYGNFYYSPGSFYALNTKNLAEFG